MLMKRREPGRDGAILRDHRLQIAAFFCMESTAYVISFRIVFFYLVATGWIFDISLLCENSINQSFNRY